MYGNCEVLMGSSNGVCPSENVFSSSPIQNPNFSNFMSSFPFPSFPPLIPKEEIEGKVKFKTGKEEMESGGSGSEQYLEGGLSGNELEMGTHEQLQQTKKKRYHRHTSLQIQEMEAMFKENAHPDDKARLRLSQELNLKPRQVKFWFQNRRTQMKAQQDRQENVVLRTENENLKSENYRLQAALRCIVCPTCGGPGMLGEMGYDEQQLRLENARLKEEFERVCLLASRYSGRPIQGMGPNPPLLVPSLELDTGIYPRQFDDPIPSCHNIMSMPLLPENATLDLIPEEQKPLALDLAMSSMNEIVKLCQAMKPLWVRDGDNGKEVLNFEEHAKMFQWPLSAKQNEGEIRLEATRASAVVIMNSITLVDAFLDDNKWMELFPTIVSRARTLQILTSGTSGDVSGSLHLMYAELQALSPLIPTREVHFLRYCLQNVEEGSWVVVDFPLESLNENFQNSRSWYKRRPSGCIIQDMPNGYSMVTWVEIAEVENKPVHQIFDNFVSSGMAFGAQRWLATLQRQCERFASLMARNISDLGVISSPEARRNLMNLAQRMIRNFGSNISTCCGHSWTALSDSADDTIRITTRKSCEPGQPNGLILSAVSTTWLPYSHNQVFDLLRDEHRRTEMDVLSNGNSLHEVAHIANGAHPGNCISILRINVASNSSQNVELVIQESCTDDSGSLVIYSTVNVEAIQLAMSSEDPSCIPLLPLGFVIIPFQHNQQAANPNLEISENGNTPDLGGCLLTIGIQALASTNPTAKLSISSVTAINNHLCNTVHQINTALMGGSDSGSGSGNGPDIDSGILEPSNDQLASVAPPKKTED